MRKLIKKHVKVLEPKNMSSKVSNFLNDLRIDVSFQIHAYHACLN